MFADGLNQTRASKPASQNCAKVIELHSARLCPSAFAKRLIYSKHARALERCRWLYVLKRIQYIYELICM